MKYLVRTALAAAFVVLLVGTGPAGANFKGSNGLIAFDSWTGTSQDIGVFDPNGGAPTMLTTTAAFSEHAPRWSPDGTKIVYMAHPQFGENDQRQLQDIWVMDADGQHKTQLTNTPYREEVPAWTADGRIVYCGQAADDLDNWDIYLINADGSGLRRLTSSPAFDCWPSPAPSGNRLAYTTVRNDVAEIVTMTLDGVELQEVTTGVDSNCVQSDWSPVGNDLVFACDDATGTSRDVWTAHQNGTGLRQLTDTPNNHEAFPSWSPDGSTIVFGRIVAPGVFNIFSLDPLTGEEELLLADSPPTTYSVAYPTWQPLNRSVELTRTNLALGRAVSASSAYPGDPASLAVDGSWWTYWSSGGFPPAWIEVDLGAPETVREIDLGITQLPDCATTHRIYGRAATSGPYRLLHEFSGYTIDQQVLKYVAASPHALRYVKVETTSSCSWVGWREIEVYG